MSKILIAEDDKFLSNAYRVKFTKEGFEVVMAGNGDEVLEKLKTFAPDLIILDLVMPNKDGFETLKSIKADIRLKDIPVIIASNLGQKDDIDLGLKLGAKDYIVKTDLSLSALITKIKSYIG